MLRTILASLIMFAAEPGRAAGPLVFEKTISPAEAGCAHRLPGPQGGELAGLRMGARYCCEAPEPQTQMSIF
jgi:hypothetical protein